MTNKTSAAVDGVLDRVKELGRCKGVTIQPECLEKYKRMEEALRNLTEMRRVHEDTYGYEKQHYIIDRNTQWAEAEEALAFDPLSSSPNSLISSAQ